MGLNTGRSTGRRRYVLVFANGPEARVRAMQAEVEALLPGYEHHLLREGSWLELIERFPPFTIAHTAALLGAGTDAALRRTALALAPTRLLAYDERGDRLHLHPRWPLKSALFWHGVPVSRVGWRPWRDETIHYKEKWEFAGKAQAAGPRVALLSPYLPWPLAHGGAVRIYSLLKEAAGEARVHLFAFLEEGEAPEPGPLLDFCERITLVRKPKYGRWSWASARPAAVEEFRTPAMEAAWAGVAAAREVDVRQVEFTQLASYGGDVLVEHDITMDLARQEYERRKSGTAWWDWWRWRRYEERVLGEYRAVVVMSEKDRAQVAHPNSHVLANGVDLERFQPRAGEEDGHLLFLGSFRHYPNALAYRFLAEELWPRLGEGWHLTAIAGPQPEQYYPFGRIPKPPGVDLRAFEPRVEDWYARAQIVVIPTPVSAGTNIKALEAMACGKAIVATPSGVNGLGLTHGREVWIAEGAAEFARACEQLRSDSQLRQSLGQAARAKAEAEFGWRAIAARQVELWKQLA
ncbi:MAG: glycosyltransferase family 4 protein [Bryobacter sp.]|nr:glycosyltransferase family 4 protein [Bryobacter sp.]